MASAQLCTFIVDDLMFGLEVKHVQEVIRYQELTHVPLAAKEIEGLINLRGQIVMAIDMRNRLGLGVRPDGSLPLNVVLTPEHGSASLLVDEIGDVLELDEDLFERSPPTLDEHLSHLLHGVYKLETGLLLVIDAGKALALKSEVKTLN